MPSSLVYSPSLAQGQAPPRTVMTVAPGPLKALNSSEKVTAADSPFAWLLQQRLRHCRLRRSSLVPSLRRRPRLVQMVRTHNLELFDVL